MLSITGWCFHVNQSVLPIRINYDKNYLISALTIEKRPDVCASYRNSLLENCGWKIYIDQPEVLDCFLLEMEIDGQWKTIFDFQFYATAPNYIPTLTVVDHFYTHPDKVREFALSQQFNEHPKFHKGKRTETQYLFPNLKKRFESILGHKITNWTVYGVNSCFQSCIAGEQLVYHFDVQQYAGIIFLTPDAPPESGTTFYRSKYTKNMKVNGDYDQVFRTGVLDPSQFDVVDVVGNKYNRLVLFDAQLLHAASSYFGDSIENGRLFQLFFFDVGEPTVPPTTPSLNKINNDKFKNIS